MSMGTEDKKRKAAAQTGIYLLVLAAIMVFANVLSAGAYKRVDVTKNERYTLSVGSGRLLSTLNGPVQVDAYVTKGLAQLDAFVRDLTDLLKEYERAGKGKFKFTIIEAKTDELRQQAKDAGLSPTAFGEASATGEDQASVAQGYMGLVFKYGSEKGVIPQLAPGRSEGLEFWITNKIREVRDKADNVKHRIGVVTGKDELKLTDTNLVPRQGRSGSPSIQSILEQAFPFYKLETVDLKNGDAEIDKGLDGLIITQPRKDYTEKELRRVDQFLMLGGKSLAVFASAVTMKPQDPTHAGDAGPSRSGQAPAGLRHRYQEGRGTRLRRAVPAAGDDADRRGRVDPRPGDRARGRRPALRGQREAPRRQLPRLLPHGGDCLPVPLEHRAA